MAEFPAMPLWTDAYLGDTTHLTTTEHGAYMLLLIAMWRSKDGFIPNDDDRLARYTHLRLDKWRKIKPTIMEFMSISAPGVTQSRLQDELVMVREKSRRQSHKAKARWLKTKETPNATASSGDMPNQVPAMPRESHSDASLNPYPITHNPKKVSTPLTPRGGSDFKEAVDEWNLVADRFGLSRVESLSAARRKSWDRHYGNGHGDKWQRALTEIGKSEFLRGSTGWLVSFDFMLRPTKIDGLVEGRYRSDPDARKSQIFKVAERMANGYEDQTTGTADQVGGNSAKALWERHGNQVPLGDVPRRIGTVHGDPTERGNSEGPEGMEVVSDDPRVAVGSEDHQENQG